MFRVRPETINKRIRDIRQLLDQAGHAAGRGLRPGRRRGDGPGPGLVHLLDKTMLLLAGRGFGGAGFLAAAAVKAEFPARPGASRRPPVFRYLPGGSYLSVTGGVKVRVITAAVTVTCHDGTSYGGVYRLAATLPGHRAYPAQALMALYHERREHEVTYLPLRRTLLQGRVPRCGDPAGTGQETWAWRTSRDDDDRSKQAQTGHWRRLLRFCGSKHLSGRG